MYRMMLVLFVFLGVVGVGTLPSAAQSAQPQGTVPTTTKERISQTTETNKSPHVAVSDRSVAVIWKRQTVGGANGDGSTAVSSRPLSGGAWTAAQKLGGDGDVAYHTPDVAISPKDQSRHVVWVDKSAGGDGYVFYQRVGADGQQGPVVQLSTTGRFATHPTITAAATGVQRRLQYTPHDD